MLYINNIYRATEGEGVRIGTPQIFIRLQGCSIACRNCDSMDTWKFDTSSAVPINRVLSRIQQLRSQWVSITGGEPLHPLHRSGLLTLLPALRTNGHKINLEASGNRIEREIFDQVDYISFDYKPPSSGASCADAFQLLSQLSQRYAHKAQIKSVVENRADIADVHQMRCRLGDIAPIPWCLTPCWRTGAAFPQQLLQQIMHTNEELDPPFRVVTQQHKLIYGSNRMDI